MQKIDMHIHTNASDGTFTPREIVTEAKKKNIEVFAVSDHDSIGNVQQTIEYAKTEGLRCISAIEATSNYQGTEYHILGYGFDINDPLILEYVAEITRVRHARESEIIAQVAKKYPQVKLEEFEKFAKTKQNGGFLSLNYLLSKNVVGGLKEYAKLKNELELFSSRLFRKTSDVIEMLHSTKATVVLAHPSYHFPGNIMDERLLDIFREFGIDGIECYSPYNALEEQTGYYKAYCRKYQLTTSGGSDCHGHFLKREMGTPDVNDELCDILEHIK